MYHININRPEDQQDLNSRELACMEDEEYFETEEEKKVDGNGKTNGDNKAYVQASRHFLIDDILSSSESDTNSEVDFKLARDNLVRIKDKLHKKEAEAQEEEQKVPFTGQKASRTPSVDKLTNRIDILLNINSMSEDGQPQNENTEEEINVKRPGSELDTEEDIRKESKIEPQKKVKL